MLHFLRTFGFDRNVAVALIPGSHFCHEIEDPPLRTHSGAYPDNRSQGRNNRAHDTKTDQYSQSAQIEIAEQLKVLSSQRTSRCVQWRSPEVPARPTRQTLYNDQSFWQAGNPARQEFHD